MQEYKTIEEKAIEWNLSSRYIQYLCRGGKIDGAIKRAGSWFIPNNAISPAQNTKSNTSEENYKFIGTKKRIFDGAIELFMLNGFDHVSLRDIAGKVGIRQSTIYNHFKSKQEILDTIYNFYSYYYLKDRKDIEDVKALLQTGDFLEILDSVRYEFKEDYVQAMSDITKIIFQRIGIDDRAKEIGQSLMIDEGIKFVEDVFNSGIKSGRFYPFDTHIMAFLINSVRIFILYCWLINPSPDNMQKLLADEQALYNYAAELIKDLVID